MVDVEARDSMLSFFGRGFGEDQGWMLAAKLVHDRLLVQYSTKQIMNERKKRRKGDRNVRKNTTQMKGEELRKNVNGTGSGSRYRHEQDKSSREVSP